MSGDRCDGCEKAQNDLVRAEGFVVSPPWKKLGEHPTLRPFRGSTGEKSGPVFCERCGALWNVWWDQYYPGYFADALDPAYGVLFEGQASVAQITPLLDRGDRGHLLLTAFLQLEHLDPRETAHAVLRALGARDLTGERARYLLHDFRAALDNPKLRPGPRPAIRLSTARPLVDLFDRDDLFGTSGNPAAGLDELRRTIVDIVRGIFGSAFYPGVKDFAAAPKRDREMLLRRAGAPERPPR